LCLLARASIGVKRMRWRYTQRSLSEPMFQSARLAIAAHIANTCARLANARIGATHGDRQAGQSIHRACWRSTPILPLCARNRQCMRMHEHKHEHKHVCMQPAHVLALYATISKPAELRIVCACDRCASSQCVRAIANADAHTHTHTHTRSRQQARASASASERQHQYSTSASYEVPANLPGLPCELVPCELVLRTSLLSNSLA
jgi:hypothetical protein